MIGGRGRLEGPAPRIGTAPPLLHRLVPGPCFVSWVFLPFARACARRGMVAERETPAAPTAAHGPIAYLADPFHDLNSDRRASRLANRRSKVIGLEAGAELEAELALCCRCPQRPPPPGWAPEGFQVVRPEAFRSSQADRQC